MKSSKACHQCRGSKRKCSRPVPGEACISCQQRSQRCSYDLQSQSPHNRATVSGPKGTKEATLSPSTLAEGSDSISPVPPDLSWDTTVELVENYFRHVHGRPHSIFHPATVRAQLRDGTLGPGLLSAVCAIGARFSSLPDKKPVEARLTSIAKQLVKADIETVSVENIQACILLAFLSATNCETSSEALFIRIAITMSEIMHLETCHDNSSTDVRETSRRIVWSLYVIDRWSSSGLGLPRSTDHLQQIIPLPINEMQFDALPRGNSIQLNSSEAPGLFAHMVKLVYNFGPIQDLNRSIATGQIQADLGRSVKAVEQQLDLWRDMLPADMQMTLQNLHDNQEVGLGAAFMALHLSYHHFSTLLYFHVLENNSVLSMAQSEHVARCKFHAASFSRILHLSQQVKGCEPNYTTIGHMTTVSSAVLVHTLLHGETQELDKARRDLNQNFAALLELHRSCPAVDVMIKRLIVFQDISLLTADSHKLDGWMVRFLLEHSLELSERHMPIVPSTLRTSCVGHSDKTDKLKNMGRFTDFVAFQRN